MINSTAQTSEPLSNKVAGTADSTAPRPDHEIDPGEIVLAILTAYPLFTKEIEKIRAGQLREMADVEDEIHRLAALVVSGAVPPALSGPSWAYSTVLDRVAAGIDHAQLEAIARVLPEPQAAMAVMSVSAKLFDFLTARVPRVVYKTQTKTVNLDPPKTDYFEFMDLFELLCEPLSIFRQVATGELVPTSVEAFDTVYPTLLQKIREAFDGAIITKLAATKSFELPPSAEFGVGVLRDDPIDAVSWQDAFIQLDATTNTGPNQPKSKSPLAAESSSGAQRALYQQVGQKPA